MDGLIGIASGMTRHRQLVVAALYLMRYLCCHHDFAIDISFQSDGDELVGMRCEKFACDRLSIACISVTANSRIDIQFTVIVCHVAFVHVNQVHRGKRLVELGVMSLDMQLQGVRLRIILLK